MAPSFKGYCFFQGYFPDLKLIFTGGTCFPFLVLRYPKLHDLLVLWFWEYFDDQQVGHLGLLTDAISAWIPYLLGLHFYPNNLLAPTLFIKSSEKGDVNSEYTKGRVVIMDRTPQVREDVITSLDSPSVHHNAVSVGERAKSEQSRQLQCLQEIQFSYLPYQGWPKTPLE